MSISPQQQMDSLLTWAPVAAGDYLFTGTPSGVAELQVGDEVKAVLIGKDGSAISQISAVCE
jgi:2-keto-4-pentenoate hydratase/2-oxohepta-3-ene-1,7-dioic acid hydratase in catechol pathway